MRKALAMTRFWDRIAVLMFLTRVLLGGPSKALVAMGYTGVCTWVIMSIGHQLGQCWSVDHQVGPILVHEPPHWTPNGFLAAFSAATPVFFSILLYSIPSSPPFFILFVPRRVPKFGILWGAFLRSDVSCSL